MAFSAVEFTYSGGPQVFPTNFALGVLEVSHIKVHVDGQVDGLGDPIDFEFTYDSGTGEVTIVNTLTPGWTGRIFRSTPIDTLLVDFEANADVTKRNLARATKQTIMAVQELTDSREADSAAVREALEIVEELESTIDSSVAAVLQGVDDAEDAADLAVASNVAAQAAAAQAQAFGTVYTQTDAELELITIPVPIVILHRIPTALGQVAPANLVTRWYRNSTPGPDPYFTTAGGVTWTVAEITQAEILSTLSSFAAGLTSNISLTGQARFANGTAVLPSLTFSTDPDTGMYRWGSNQIGFTTGGTVKVIIGEAAMAIDIPIIGSAITQTATDTTAGRLMKVGDAGLLGPVVITGGAATLRARALKSGLWGYNSGSLPQHPEDGLAYAHSMLTMMAPNAMTGAGDRSSYLTGRVTGTASSLRLWWGVDSNVAGEINWAEVITNRRILGGVSQTGGVATGAVIERGSNANGEYVRFADGTLICTFTAPAVVCTTTSGALFTSVSASTWTFPSAFAVGSLPVVSGNGGDVNRWLAPGLPTNTSTDFRVYCYVSAAATIAPRLHAVGRWF